MVWRHAETMHLYRRRAERWGYMMDVQTLTGSSTIFVAVNFSGISLNCVARRYRLQLFWAGSFPIERYWAKVGKHEYCRESHELHIWALKILKNVAATRMVEGARSFPMECHCANVGYYVNSWARQPANQRGGAEIQFWMGAQNRPVCFAKWRVRSPKGSKSDPWHFMGGPGPQISVLFPGNRKLPNSTWLNWLWITKIVDGASNFTIECY